MSENTEFKVQIRERTDSSEEYKRPELLQKAIEEIEAEVAAKEAEGDSSSDDDSSSYDSDQEEDEDANLLTPAVDSQIFRTIAAIRSKDPRVYEQSSTFYDEDTSETPSTKKKEKAVKLKDYERDILLNHGGMVDESKETVPTKTHTQEQEELRNAFKLAAEDDDEEEDGFLTKKVKTEEEEKKEDSDYRQFLLEHMKDDEPSKKAFEEWNNYKSNPNVNPEDAFLMDYVLNRGWVDKGDAAKPLEDDIDKDKEEEYLDDVDRFESKYNFRFEEEGAAEIKTYARNVEGSVRRKESKRARRREREKLHKKALKEQKMLELKEQKNKKMKEIHEKLKELRDITGSNAPGLENIDLEGDFDPTMYDAQMNSVFNDDYYGEGDPENNEKPTWDDDDIMDADYLPGGDKYVGDEEASAAEVDPETKKAQKRKFDELMDEYYSLNYEDVIGGDVYTRFKYVKTEPVDYGLTAEEILLADDKELNKYVGMKSLAPYRDEKKVKKELKILEKSKDKKKKSVLKSVKKAKKEVEKIIEEETKSSKKHKKKSKKTK